MIANATRTAIDAALAARDVAGAAALAEAALARGEEDGMLLNLAAWAREEAGDYAGAHKLIDRAVALAPGDPQLLSARGEVLLKEGRLSEAVRCFDDAIRREPGLAAAWLGRAVVLETGSSLAAARESFGRALTLDPRSTAAWAGRASVAGRLGDHAAARADAARALALDPGESTAHCALARTDTEEGRPEVAAARMRAMLASADLTPHKRMLAHSLLGDALAKFKDSAGAFAAYAESKALFATINAPRMAPYEGHRALLERTAAAVARLGPALAPPAKLPPVEGAAAAHVFLLGFPRSGTTLVENVLASAEGAAALEERPTLRDADAAFLEPADGLDRLAAASADELAHYREAYWRRVREAGVAPGARLFVDMDPFKGAQLPEIVRLFPEARVVVMRRDPRDVVWSCFRSNFALTPAAMEFTEIVRTAEDYAAMMRLIERCAPLLGDRLHEVRYDRLVADFDATTGALCDFTGIGWTPAMRDFGKTAAARGVTTLSVGQVTKPLYDGGGQWRRFAAQLAPALPILAPWVEKFGFAP